MNLFEQYIALIRRYQTDPTALDELNRVRALLYQMREREPLMTCALAHTIPQVEPHAPPGMRSLTPRRTQKRQSICLQGD